MLQMSRSVRLVGALVLSAFLLLAQLNRGSITGTVTDNSGSVIPNVKLTLRNAATGALYEAASNENGQYTAPNLPTGTYDITFEAPSFKKVERKGVELSVTQVLRVDATLEVGSVTESVSVTAEAPRLQTDSPDVGTTLSNKQLIDLPLTFAGARVAENFAYLVTPGVSGNTWTSNINGSTSFSKESLLDGATVTTYLAGHFSESSVSVEALQEFKIQTSGMSAEFGRAQAGVFNYVMKSGANQIHGSAYGALRNEALNANTAVTNSTTGNAGSIGGRTSLSVAADPSTSRRFITAPTRPSSTPRSRNTASAWRLRRAERHSAATRVSRWRLQPAARTCHRSERRAWPSGPERRDLRSAHVPATRQRPMGRRHVPGQQDPGVADQPGSQRVNALLRNGYLPTVRNPDGTIPLTNNAIRPAAGTPEFDQYQFSTKIDQNIGPATKLAGSISYNKRPRLLLDQTRLWNPDDPIGGVLTSARRQTIKSELARISHDWNVKPRFSTRSRFTTTGWRTRISGTTRTSTAPRNSASRTCPRSASRISISAAARSSVSPTSATRRTTSRSTWASV